MRPNQLRPRLVAVGQALGTLLQSRPDDFPPHPNTLIRFDENQQALAAARHGDAAWPLEEAWSTQPIRLPDKGTPEGHRLVFVTAGTASVVTEAGLATIFQTEMHPDGIAEYASLELATPERLQIYDSVAGGESPGRVAPAFTTLRLAALVERFVTEAGLHSSLRQIA